MGAKGPTSNLLSATDAAFLYLERKEIPLSIAMVCVFNRPIPFQKFVSDIESKLHLLPRYQQIVVASPFDIGYPVWEDDPHFDIRRHIFRARLDPPGGDAELEALTGRLIGRLMDREKPLWDIHVVNGLKNRRSALIVRLHHALADGVSGVAAIMGVMLDSTPEGSRTISRPPSQRPQAADRSIKRAVANAVYSTLESLDAVADGLRAFGHAFRSGSMQTGLKSAAGLLPEISTAFERLPFNKPCTGARKFCWAEFDLAEVQAIRKAAGGTINDVVLTVLTRAVARYTELHGESVVRRLVRVVCPVNVREDQSEIGNRISFLPVVLPLDSKDAVETLRAVATRMEIMKQMRAAEMVALLAGCLGAVPPPAQAAFWRGIPEFLLPLPLFNMICTNIPGSRQPLYSIGRRMIASYPQVPTGYELGINCAVTSYDGKLFFGLIADTVAAPDVDRMRDFLYSAFAELRRSAGVDKRPHAVASATRSGARPQVEAQTGKAGADIAPPAPVAAAAPARARKQRTRLAGPVPIDSQLHIAARLGQVAGAEAVSSTDGLTDAKAVG